MKRIKAVAFTDSVHYLGWNEKKKIIEWFRKTTRNWVSSSEELDVPVPYRRDCSDCEVVSAGTDEHVWTSHVAKDSVFKFIYEKLHNDKENVAGCSGDECETPMEIDSETEIEALKTAHGVETERSKLEDETNNDGAKGVSDTPRMAGNSEEGDSADETKNFRDENTTKHTDSVNNSDLNIKCDRDVTSESKDGQETASSASSDLHKEETKNNEETGSEEILKKEEDNKEKVSDVKRNGEEGNGEMGNKEMGDEEMGNEKTGIEEIKNEETENEEKGNEEKGNEDMGSEKTGIEEIRNEETVNEETGNEETGNEETGNEEMGNEEMGDEDMGNEKTGNGKTGNEEMGNEEMGDEDMGNEKTGSEEIKNEETGNEEMGNEEMGNEDVGNGNEPKENPSEKKETNKTEKDVPVTVV